MTLTDEEIRLKAVEISCNAVSREVSAMIVSGRSTKFHLGMVDDIVEYVKTGKKPE